ncbi:MAG: hypothetical protein ACI4PG_09885 [Candidatus Ventricola sp.]
MIQAVVYTSNTGSMAKKLAAKADRTPEENDLLEWMQHGGSRVSLKNLAAPIRWCRENLGGAGHE